MVATLVGSTNWQHARRLTVLSPTTMHHPAEWQPTVHWHYLCGKATMQCESQTAVSSLAPGHLSCYSRIAGCLCRWALNPSEPPPPTTLAAAVPHCLQGNRRTAAGVEVWFQICTGTPSTGAPVLRSVTHTIRRGRLPAPPSCRLCTASCALCNARVCTGF
jgi:hypothetical protein